MPGFYQVYIKISMENLDCFQPRVIIITGASRGIGRAVAQKFASNGDYVALVADQKDELEESAALIKNADNYLLLHGDLADDDFLQQVVDDTLAKWGRIDGLVNNAAWRTVETLRTISLDNWEKTIKICLTAPVFLSRLVAESMEKKVLLVSSSISAVSWPPEQAGPVRRILPQRVL